MSVDPRTFLKRSGKATRPPLEGIYIYILSMFIGFTVADLSILKYRPEMLPKEAPPTRPEQRQRRQLISQTAYDPIIQRNIFNADGEIPPPLSSEGEPTQDEDAPAVLSQLPLKLLGTIVHVNPKRSIATVLLNNRNESKSFRVDEEIEGLARVTKIERRKLTFRNLNNNRLEYIEIPEDVKITFGKAGPKTNASDTEIAKRGEFDFALQRETLNKYTSDLTGILRQARMVPNIVPGSGGRVEGFRFVSIQPGSLFEELGFRPGDVIQSVNGEPVNSPTKAMELYNSLKTENQVVLGVNRGGRNEEFRYNIED